MITYIRGELAAVRQNTAILENQGIGYEIYIPLPVAEELSRRIKEEITLWIYMNVKEDGINLFGFLTEDELDVFKLLITVSGIGPKGAIAILSAMSTDDLRFAVLSDDAKSIAKAPGIGAKTAGKLILELKDKLKLEDAFEAKWSKSGTGKGAAGEAEALKKSRKDDAMEALIALGYSPSDSIKAVRSIDITEDMSTEDILKLSLKMMLR